MAEGLPRQIPKEAQRSAVIELGKKSEDFVSAKMDPKDPSNYGPQGSPRMSNEAAQVFAEKPGVKEAEEKLAAAQAAARLKGDPNGSKMDSALWQYREVVPYEVERAARDQAVVERPKASWYSKLRKLFKR